MLSKSQELDRYIKESLAVALAGWKGEGCGDGRGIRSPGRLLFLYFFVERNLGSQHWFFLQKQQKLPNLGKMF